MKKGDRLQAVWVCYEERLKYRKLNLQDKTSLTKRGIDKYDGNSVTGRMSAGTEAA